MKKRLKFIRHYTRKYSGLFVIIFIIILVTTFIVLLYPYIFGRLVDEVYYNKNIAYFKNIILIYLGLYSLNQVLHFLLDYTAARVMTKFIFNVQRDMFNKVLSYESKLLNDLDIGDLVFRISKDSKEMKDIVYSIGFYGIASAIEYLFCVAFIAYISWPIAIVSVVFSLLTVITTRLFSKKIKKINEKIISLKAKNESWTFEFIKSINNIKGLGTLKGCIEYFKKQLIRISRHTIKQVKWESMSQSSLFMIDTASKLITFTVAALLILAGYLTLGGFVAVMDYFKRMVIMINRIADKIIALNKSLVSIDRLIEISEQPSEDINEYGIRENINYGEILFHDISFSYDEGTEILSNVSFSINPKEKIAIVGPSGTGKTTISNLLTRLYDVKKGSIIIDGININEYNRENLREQIGIVYQDVFLFDDTIRFNIAFTNEKHHDEEILTIIESLNLTNLFTNMKNGLDSQIDASRVKMSGGQKQRIAIARLMLRKPKIVIFDEATSALDGKNEYQVISRLKDTLKDSTIIIISHRLSTIVDAEKIICLDDKGIVGFNTHENLIQSCETYQKLFFGQIVK